MMTKMKQIKILILITITLLFSSCGTIKEGFKNQKKNNTDEFLVEKKSPLVMPPDYNELPVPQKEIASNEKEENEIKKLISSNEDNKIENDIVEKNQTFEDSLLKKIKDN